MCVESLLSKERCSASQLNDFTERCRRKPAFNEVLRFVPYGLYAWCITARSLLKKQIYTKFKPLSWLDMRMTWPAHKNSYGSIPLSCDHGVLANSRRLSPNPIIMLTHASRLGAIASTDARNVILAHHKSVWGKIWRSTTPFLDRKRVSSKSKNLELGPRNGFTSLPDQVSSNEFEKIEAFPEGSMRLKKNLHAKTPIRWNRMHVHTYIMTVTSNDSLCLACWT